jgi:23S rRNA (uracil1939-C5)-methyltransferase
LQRIGKISYPIPPVLASETLFGYRRHISLQLEYKDDKWQIGFSSINGNFLPIKSCLLFHSLGDPVLTLLQEALKELPSSPAGRIKILKAPSGYVLAFSFPYSLEEDSLSFFSTLAKNSLFIGICLQTPSQELSWKNPDLFYTYKDLTFSYSPFSFIQNHEEQSARIYEHVVNLLEPSSKILDLYCGIGITTLLLSKRNKQVLGIEINPVAISHAKENAKRNGLNPEIFICASADNATEEIASFAPDAILVNPPKTGLSPLVQKSLAFPSIKKIVYISCHPPTLARDCLTLTSQGFSLSHVQSFDMFPQTTHVETVVVFSRNT